MYITKMSSIHPEGFYKRNQRLIHNIIKDYQLMLMILLPLIWLLIFRYYPMYGTQIAFRDFRATGGITGSPWVGFKHFIRFANSYNFSLIFFNTLGLSIYQLAAGFPIPIILALSLNSARNAALKKTVQFATYMPYFISVVVLVGMVLQYLNPHTGVVNTIIRMLGGNTIDFMGIPEYFKSIYVWSGVWQSAGWGTIIYLASLSGVNPSLYESSTIDGASRFQQILHIDLPSILPTIIIVLIINMGGIMHIGFEKVFLMQNPLNLSAAEVISTYVYRIGLASSTPNFSYAAAIGLFNSVINLFMIITVNYIAKKAGETSLW